VIPIGKRGAVCFESPYGNRDAPFPYRDLQLPVSCRGQISVPQPKFFGDVQALSNLMDAQNYSPCFHVGTSRMETGRQIKNSYLEIPRSEIDFVSIWGLAYACLPWLLIWPTYLF
jgi:hypothetical protein